ncbi:hypothetical protein V1520DRAFT_390766 [Lipomyces starkeyi]|uniref:WSC domain-containing protein n=1 Tax=Lipomyces starkeyi NRRL Y-11557 TaxID=675824 RepID=A0A1E3PXV1_LIPST|nr:hypothetical protein LIPSTDRAFT_175468 [Lipomyces starkeyi NRRL Y-11557]
MFWQIMSLSLVQQISFVLLARVSAVDAAILTAVGCYSSSGSLVFNDTYKYQTQNWCQGLCAPMGDSVLGLTNGGDCWCGNAIPSGKVDSSYCNVGCNGYGLDDCGGVGYYTIYLTGVGTLQNPSESSSSSSAESSSSSSSSSSTSSVTSTESSSSSDGMSTSEIQSTTIDSSSSTTSSSAQSTSTDTMSVTAGLTVTTTVPASQSSTGGASNASAGSSSANSGNSSSSHGISGGGIAGIVIGVIAGLAIIAALVFFFIRRRRRDDDDDWSDYHGGKGKSRGLGGGSSNNPIVAPAMPHEKLSSNSFNSGRVAIVDQRLNPVMMERRLSDGSLSDEQDYSRKILRVVNMD